MKIIINSFFCFFICTLYFSSCRSNQRNGSSNIDDDSTVVVTTIPATPLPDKANYNIYIENSASMDAYVKGVTDFEISIYDFSTKLEDDSFANSWNYFYINSKPIFYGNSAKSFIHNLSPLEFKKRGGNKGDTKLDIIIEQILEKVDSTNVNILISDFIFSPGHDNLVDALGLLINDIEGPVSGFRKGFPDLALLVYQLESEFDGYYYDRNNSLQRWTGVRPFYMWIMGHKQHIQKLIEHYPASNFKGSGILNSAMYYAGKNKITYQVVPALNYKLKTRGGNLKTDIIKMKKDRITGTAKITVNVNYDDLLLDEPYLMDIKNYSTSDGSYKVTSVLELKNDPTYTHAIIVESDIIKPSKLEISLAANTPQWIDDMSDNEGLKLDETNKHKTFGLKYLLQGVNEGFSLNNHNYFTIHININQN